MSLINSLRPGGPFSFDHGCGMTPITCPPASAALANAICDYLRKSRVSALGQRGSRAGGLFVSQVRSRSSSAINTNAARGLSTRQCVQCCSLQLGLFYGIVCLVGFIRAFNWNKYDRWFLLKIASLRRMGNKDAGRLKKGRIWFLMQGVH